MQKADNNVINNYKGVMLCSRPNQVNVSQTEKPFCGRVVPPQQLGLVPVKNQKQQPQTKKKRNTILNRHKKWLNEFKTHIVHKKEQVSMTQYLQAQKAKKIKEQAEADRERARKMKQQYNKTATEVINILDQQKPSKKAQLTVQNLRKFNQEQQKGQNSGKVINTVEDNGFKKKKGKNDKPLWAQTKQQVQNKQQEEVDQLINFFDTNQVNEYAQDQQVQEMLKNLKQKIERLKNTDNWKQKQTKRMQQKKNRDEKDDNDDKYSNFSVQSDGKSVASEKSQKRMQQLRQKLDKKQKGQQDWDKFTTTSKHTANIQDRIAKNLADEVLRNYPHLKGVHSNVSIRKLIQAQASKAIYQPINRPVITTIVRQKIPLDTNNLPYLHRNPAI